MESPLQGAEGFFFRYNVKNHCKISVFFEKSHLQQIRVSHRETLLFFIINDLNRFHAVFIEIILFWHKHCILLRSGVMPSRVTSDSKGGVWECLIGKKVEMDSHL